MTARETPRLGEEVYSAFLEDAGAYMVILDGALCVRDVSESSCDLVGATREEAIGRPLADLLAPPVREERLGIARQAMRAGHPVRVVGMVRGRWMQLCYRPIRDAGDEVTGMVVCGGRCVSSAARDDGVLTVHAHTHDLGTLAVLSRREMEVLRLIAQGLSVTEIAGAIYRSPKTVESHRRSLGLKLGIKNRSELWRIAHDAGLLWIEDADFDRLIEVMHNDTEPDA